MTEEQKIELAKYRHEDQARLSFHLSNIDFKIFSGFVTLQIIACGYIVSIRDILTPEIQGVFLIIDSVLCVICAVMLSYHKNRRKEMSETIKNCNEFLGYTKAGVYLEHKALNANTKDRYWFKSYVATIVALWIAFAALVFFLE